MRARTAIALASVAVLLIPAQASASVGCTLEGDALALSTSEFAEGVALVRDGDAIDVVGDDDRGGEMFFGTIGAGETVGYLNRDDDEDVVVADAVNVLVRGEGGDDYIVGNGPPSLQTFLQVPVTLVGGSGNDLLDGGRGRDDIDCGGGRRDAAFASARDRIRNCEGKY